MRKKFLKKLQKLVDKSKVIHIDDTSKIIFFSDCHRGYGDHADDFAHNQLIFITALTHYYNKGYTYIELGDGDELWENKDFNRIKENYRTIFEIFDEFHINNRLYYIWGNHNRRWKNQKKVKKEFSNIIDDKTRKKKPIFKNLKVHESLVLQYKNDKNKILVIHGHQGDCLNDECWFFGRIIVRNIWKFLQSIFGWPDPTSPARNFHSMQKTDKRFKYWIDKKKIPVIIGHTHKPVFPKKGEPPYFNDGSCVHPRCITGIEISQGKIQLVKWYVDVNLNKEQKRYFYVNKRILAGSRKIEGVFIT